MIAKTAQRDAFTHRKMNLLLDKAFIRYNACLFSAPEFY